MGESDVSEMWIFFIRVSFSFFLDVTSVLKNTRLVNQIISIRWKQAEAMAMAWISNSSTMRNPIRWKQTLSYKSFPCYWIFSGEKSTRLFSELCCCHFCNALNSLKSSSLQYVKSETKSSNDDKVKLYRVIKFKLIPQKAHLKVL